MNTFLTPADGSDPGYIYSPDDYFAFVESSDPLVRSMMQAHPTALAIDLILTERRANKLPPPARAIWLDCIQSQYFMRLSWRDEICEIGNVEHSDRRRQQLQSLDPSYLRAALLLIEPVGPAEVGAYGEFNRATWHRIILADGSGLPTLVGADFDMDPDNRVLRHLRYLGVCSEFERKALTNVFSLDFLPNANLGKLERGNPETPPHAPHPTGEKGEEKEAVGEVEEDKIEDEIEYREPLRERYRQMV